MEMEEFNASLKVNDNLKPIYRVLMVSAHAPGMSAYNYVERRMVLLSKELTGVVLPHNTFGTHLDGKKTIDEELEK